MQKTTKHFQLMIVTYLVDNKEDKATQSPCMCPGKLSLQQNEIRTQRPDLVMLLLYLT